ncbi:hypothetical protein PENCOP_c008G07144 [Penicillium coprophilum]|uniref:NWD NACHT-NTPase N-terminal domain-containing protein n=1 Tax=Penicillium coprophilum TaxID=36646 RepID=A0A1V6UJD2_9EURO|nr:hypothetical protein PENCOP_c008G07144 [Penicillium coprophilum]
MTAPSPTSKPSSSLKLQATGHLVAVASLSPSAGSSPTPSKSGSQDIGTWNGAYEVAETRKPELMRDYASHLASLQGKATTKRIILSSEFVENAMNRLLKDQEKKQWRLPLLGNNVIVRRQAEKLTKYLLWADPVVKSAVSTQPYVALAWSSLSILLPNVVSWNDWVGKACEIEDIAKDCSILISLDNEKEIRERWDRQLCEIQESHEILQEIQRVRDESRRHGADVNSKDGDSGTALHIASTYNYPNNVLASLESGADVNHTDERHGPALDGAFREGNREIVNILLEKEADVKGKDIVTVLLESGTDVDYYDPIDGTALLGACCPGHREVFKILLENGALDFEHGYYGSALHVACNDLKQPDKYVYSDMRYNHQTHGTPLQTASKRGGQLIIKILLAIGDNPNIRSGDGSSATQEASFHGHQAVVDMSLNDGAHVNFQGEGNYTTLQMAAREGHRTLVALLLDHGADVTIKGELYGTALDAATEQGHTEWKC